MNFKKIYYLNSYIYLEKQKNNIIINKTFLLLNHVQMGYGSCLEQCSVIKISNKHFFRRFNTLLKDLSKNLVDIENREYYRASIILYNAHDKIVFKEIEFFHLSFYAKTVDLLINVMNDFHLRG